MTHSTRRAFLKATTAAPAAAAVSLPAIAAAGPDHPDAELLKTVGAYYRLEERCDQLSRDVDRLHREAATPEFNAVRDVFHAHLQRQLKKGHHCPTAETPDPAWDPIKPRWYDEKAAFEQRLKMNGHDDTEKLYEQTCDQLWDHYEAAVSTPALTAAGLQAKMDAVLFRHRNLKGPKEISLEPFEWQALRDDVARIARRAGA